MPISAQFANADLSITKDDGSVENVPLLLDPTTGGLLVRAVGAGGGAADSTYAMQTKQQATLESMDGKLPALVNGAVPTIDTTTDVNVTGTLTGGSPTLEIDVTSIYNTAIELSGTWSGVVNFEYTVDASSPTWFPLKVSTQGGSEGAIQSSSVNGLFFATTGGMQKIRCNFSPATSGTVNVTYNASIAQQALSVNNLSENIWSCSFANTNASALSCDQFRQIYKGPGITLSQASGNLAVVSSTNANEEWLAVSTRYWSGAMLARYKTILSQRIANNNFVVMLADKLGEGLTLTVNSATSVTVSAVPGTWSAENVGQFMHIGAVGGLAGMTPGRFAIASVSGSDLTFTVAAMGISSGTTTCTLFGWNYYRALYDSTTATNAKVDAQRKGWATGDTTATISTTASPGHTAAFDVRGREFGYTDSLVASASTTAPRFTQRASRFENIPDQDVQLYLFLWAFNGTTNPASTTTWTIGFTSVESYPKNPVFLAGANMMGTMAPLAVVGGDANNNLDINVARLAATTLLNGGISGSLAVGGATGGGVNSTGIQNFATTAQHPLTMAGIDSFNQVHRVLTDSIGQQSTIGSGEIVNSFSLTAAAATFAEGTNARTILLPPSDGVIELDFVRVATTPSIVVSVTYGNGLWESTPLQRVDNTSATNTLSTQTISGVNTFAFTPIVQSKWRGKIAGAIAVRIHQVAGTANETVGLFRYVPLTNNEAGTVSRAFAFGTASTTESFGAATAGIVAFTAGSRTLLNTNHGGGKLRINLDAYVSIASAGVAQLTPEGTLDLATAAGATWYTMPLANLSGGFHSSSFIELTTAGPAVFEADVSPFKVVRLRETGVSTATCVAFGSMKIAPLSKQQLLSGFGSTPAVFNATAESQIFAAQPYRKIATITNETAATLFVLAVPGTASSTNYTAALSSGDVLNLSSPGAIRGVFATTTGIARYSELL